MIRPDVLYVGYPKTASTFLRRYFDSHPKIIQEEQQISQVLYHKNYRPNLIDKPRSRICIQSDESVAESVCVVGEIEPWSKYLYNWGEFNKVKFDIILDPHESARRLHKNFPDAKVLMVIREQADWFGSLYKYVISSLLPHHRSFAQYMQTPQGIAMRHAGYHDNTIAAYWGVFGNDSVKVLRYEDLKNDQCRFLQNVCSFVGVEYAPMAMERVNESHASMSRLHRAMPFLSFLPPPLKAALRPAIRWLPGKKGTLLTEHEIASIRSEYAESNTRTAKLLCA